MFKRKPKPEPTGLDKAIESLYSDLLMYDPAEDKYAAVADQLAKLYKLRSKHDKPAEKFRPSADTLTIAAANILAVVVIVGYEQKHVVATKAMTFWHKLG